MAAFPRRIRRGSGGDVYYFDGVHAGTILPAGSGIGTIMAGLGDGVPYGELSAADFDAIQSYFEGRDRARANQIASAVNA